MLKYISFIVVILASFLSGLAFSGDLKDAQLSTLASGIRESTVPEVVAAVAIRDDGVLAMWCNKLSATDAWNEKVTAQNLVDAMDFTKYDALLQGKRDAWHLFLSYAPYDFGTVKNRRVIEDVWGLTDGVPVLTAALRKANNCELILGGTSETRNTVTGLDLRVERIFTTEDISAALNRF